MNGRANCLLGVCCRARSAGQKAALAEQMVEDLGCDPKEAKKYAAWIANTFDLAPSGSLEAFKSEVAKLARENR
jgi:hypothetical protein